ncbi:MAG: hypothetical protein HUU50_02835 [Candidatus Brocadiae bacterium]|nr:hypothetical protein [Candidatus Brocadiia bacterium]
MILENFLALLQNVKKSGENWIARCPSHDDRHNSLSIGLGSDEKILIKCHAGCRGEEILQTLGLSWKDLFPQTDFRKSYGITVADLAFAKGLPEEFLQNLGIEPKGNWLRIPYYMEDGTLAPRQRKRWALSAKEGSAWEAGEGHPVPYGLWKLKEARKEGYLFLVEGESDCWTLWYHGYPALGLPGADMAKKIALGHVAGIKKIYIIKEPDKGGETFVHGIRRRLEYIGYKGIAFVIEMQGVKDPNEMHQRSRHFKEDFQKLIEQAKPLLLAELDIIIEYGSLIPALPEPANKTVLELMKETVGKGESFAILAPQGSGKSYTNAYIAVSELKKGRSVLIASRSHDELNQLGQTIKSLLFKFNLSAGHLFHLKGSPKEGDENKRSKKIPDIRPIIVIAPHVYFTFKGETPYHHTLVNMLFNKEFGESPLVLIDEFVSFLESTFLSKELGSRNSLKSFFGQELWLKNSLCPLFTASGNCLNCFPNKLLQLRSGKGGMLNYAPISQHHKEDKLNGEEVTIDHLVNPDMYIEDNTMRVYQVMPVKTFSDRQWSTGCKDAIQLEVTLKAWVEDILTRLIEPSLVIFYPYDSESKKNLGRALTETELNDRKKDKRKKIPPRHVCGVPILQGWDLSILRKIKENAQIGLTGPSASDADRYVLCNALGEISYHIAKSPYVCFQNLLIVAIEKELRFEDKETQNFLLALTQSTKVLSFLPTYYEAAEAEKEISEKVRTMYYDGAQKIRNAPIQGTSIEFDLCISCIHGPLGQGLDLGQFKIAMVSTSCERPKCLFVGRPATKTNKEYIVDDVADKSRQAAMRILRLTSGEDENTIRIFLFYGRYALDVSHRVEMELTKVGHHVTVINAQTCVRYAQDFILNWLRGLDTSSLKSIGVEQYEEEHIINEAKTAIENYLQEHPNAGWRELSHGPRIIRELPALYKDQIKNWFQEHINAVRLQASIKKTIEEIKIYQEHNPSISWTDIRHKFHLERKTKEEQRLIRQYIVL